MGCKGMLTSLKNPLARKIRRLHQAKGRRQEQCFLLEGTHLLEAALAAQCPLLAVCCTAVWREHHLVLWEQLHRQTRQVEIVSPELLRAIATTVNPDGVVAVVARDAVHTQSPTACDLGLALETLQDPGNLGTIIRTAVAAQANRLWLSADSVDLDHPKVLRASAGQWFQLSMMVSPDLKAVLRQCQHEGMQVVATKPDAVLNYWQADLKGPTLLVLGNEGAGLSRGLLELADRTVKIPVSSGVESLNVAIAAALLLYEAQRQRHLKTPTASS